MTVTNPPSLSGEVTKAEFAEVTLGSKWSAGDLLGARVSAEKLLKAPAHKLDLRDGTAAAPVKIGVSASISRTDATSREEVNEDLGVGTDGPDGATVLRASIKGTPASQVQLVGVVATAWQTGAFAEAGADACPFFGNARISNEATGRAIGAYLESVRETETSRGQQALELRVKNSTATGDGYLAAEPSKSMGIWLNPSGTSTSACAIQLGHGFGKTFDVGIGVNEGAIGSASFRDDSAALRSIFVKGTHAKAAIAVAAGSGPVVIGGEEASGANVRFEVLAGEVTSDPMILFGSATETGYSVQLKNSKGSLKSFISAAVNQFITGTAKGDAGHTFTPGQTYHIGAIGKTSQVRVQEAKIGFYGVAPVARAAAIAEPELLLLKVQEAVNKIREVLKNIGITE